MKRGTWVGFGVALVLLTLVSAICVVGQEKQQQRVDADVVFERRIIESPPEPFGPPPHLADKTFTFVASEMGFEGKLVKNAPYSAQAVTEITQTLNDGNRLVNKSSSLIYRDSEGRTRREHTLRSIGPFANSGSEPVRTIFINDPVAGVNYTLDTRTHVAHKSQPVRVELAGTPGERWAGPAPHPEVFSLRAPAPAPAAGIATQFIFRREDPENVSTESLGKQVIEGVEAEGTRSTRIIPAGEIGNERPIQIVTERWYSPELQTVISSRHSDPLTGETVYRLTNISREEPARSLFEVPADYTVKEGTPGTRIFRKQLSNP